jgi:tRNA1(Val) A37 N6-methylase TrmN6
MTDTIQDKDKDKDKDKETVPDRFLDGRLILQQRRQGYRAAMDPVLLAAAVPECTEGKVLDLGCGVGTALFCYGKRMTEPALFGLELDGMAADLARQNARENNLADRTEIVTGDLLSMPKTLEPNSFDQVFANPPYLESQTGETSPIADRARSNVEGAARLKDWIRIMLKMTKPRGGLTLIHRADRLDDILALLYQKAGEIVVLPLWPRAGEPAKRVIVRARKGVRGSTTLLPGLALHGPVSDPDGRYTREALAILRDGEKL